jgi:membrane protein DedA with SNARE-associated domain
MQMWWASQGFWVTLALLFAVALLRGQATYGLARWLTHQTLRHTHPTGGWAAATHRWLNGEGTARGRAALQRWGLVVVPLSYLTVGFQTLVLTAAGVTRIRWAWFTLAQLPGAMAWALIYATIGFAVWQAGLAAAAGSPLALVAFAAIALVYAATLVSRRRRARATARGSNEDPPGLGT